MGLQLGPLRQVMLPSSDLDRSVAFYADVLGARLIGRFPPGLAFFALGETRLLLEAHEGDTKAAGALYFAVDDIRAAIEELSARGVVFDAAPELIFHDATGTFGDAGQDEWLVFFRDPDDNVLALASREAKR